MITHSKFTGMIGLGIALCLLPVVIHAQTAPKSTLYGYSVEGRSLIAYTFGDGQNTTLIMASIHGNERDTRPLAEQLIAYLTDHPDSYHGCTVTVIPCVNPDGWANNTRINAHHVDLNRNFSVGWKPSDSAHLKRGAAPLSEPEARALAIFVMQLKPSKIVSIHNPLHLLDFTGNRSLELAKTIAQYDHYPIPKNGVGYPTPGSLGNFAAKKIGCEIVTLELPNESVAEAWNQNRDALLAVIKLIPNKK